jgi:hypothetical protein
MTTCKCCGKEVGGRPAGRPPVPFFLKRVQVSYKIPRWLKEWIDKQEKSGGRVIEKAVIAFYGLSDLEKEIKAEEVKKIS